MSFDLQIREQISRYCAGQIDAAALETWLSAATWDLDDESRATRQLAFDALRFTSEAAHGDWTDQELREHLGALCMVTDDAGSVLAGAPAVPAREQFLDRLAAAEKTHSEPVNDEARLAALMHYAGAGTRTPQWSETGQSSGPGFLDRPTSENETPGSAPAELAIS